MSKFQKIIIALLVIITLSIVYFFVIRPNLSKNIIQNQNSINPAFIVKSVAEKQQWNYTLGNWIIWYYDDINKWISSRNGYTAELKIYTEPQDVPSSYNELFLLPQFQSMVSSVRTHLEENWFVKNDQNSIKGAGVDDVMEFFEWYENSDTKCSISMLLWEFVEVWKWTSYMPLRLTCADNFDTQKSLQIQLLDVLWYDDSWIYADKQSDDFVHAFSMDHWYWGVEMIFRKKWNTYELIYEWNSWISCSIVRQYNIPFAIVGECD